MNPLATSPGLRHPALELLARYRAVLGAAWAARHELVGPKRLADEAAFLPAALAIQETPVHPAPRRAAWAIMALFAIALAWSYFGWVDIVAVAPGRIVVSDGTQVIQPLEPGVIKAIHVQDGSHVQAGQVVIELDPTTAAADQQAVAAQAAATKAEYRRAFALASGVRLVAAQAAPAPTVQQHIPEWPDAQARAEWADLQAKLARLEAEAGRRQAELATARQAQAKLQVTVPLSQQREADVAALAAQGFVAGHAGQDRTRERIELERDLATQTARVEEAEAALAESRQTRAALLAETARSLSDRVTKSEQDLAQLHQQGTKAAHRERMTLLRSPVTGTVQQLAVRTTGGVVTAAQPLLVVVPDDAAITAEVSVENKDIGFVRLGQEAAVKLEAFPFTRYGTVPAVVTRLSADAVVDEKRGPTFMATVTLANRFVPVDGGRAPIGAGMSLSAEVKTGRRRVLDLLLSPVQQALLEGGRER